MPFWVVCCPSKKVLEKKTTCAVQDQQESDSMCTYSSIPVRKSPLTDERAVYLVKDSESLLSNA